MTSYSTVAEVFSSFLASRDVASMAFSPWSHSFESPPFGRRRMPSCELYDRALSPRGRAPCTVVAHIPEDGSSHKSPPFLKDEKTPDSLTAYPSMRF